MLKGRLKNHLILRRSSDFSAVASYAAFVAEVCRGARPGKNSQPISPVRVLGRSEFHLDRPRRLAVITFVTTSSMVLELKLRKVGNSVGVVLPKEALARLNSGEGGTLVLTDAPDGSFRLASNQADFGQQMKAAEDVIRRYRNTLRELAK